MKKQFGSILCGIILMLLTMAGLTSCSEDYSVGERVGVVTQFSYTGVVWKSYEGHLNITQTGMNTGGTFDFSIDNDLPEFEVTRLTTLLEEASTHGYKVKLIYHETFGYNWWNNRGGTNHFVTEVIILDTTMANPLMDNPTPPPSPDSTTTNNNTNTTTDPMIDSPPLEIIQLQRKNNN